MSETLAMPAALCRRRHGRKGIYRGRLGRPVVGDVPAFRAFFIPIPEQRGENSPANPNDHVTARSPEINKILFRRPCVSEEEYCRGIRLQYGYGTNGLSHFKRRHYIFQMFRTRFFYRMVHPRINRHLRRTGLCGGVRVHEPCGTDRTTFQPVGEMWSPLWERTLPPCRRARRSVRFFESENSCVGI